MSAQDLLLCFFESCQENFHYLHHDHHFQPITGLVERIDQRQLITPYHATKAVDYPFFATCRYEHKDLCFEVNYGDYNFGLTIHIIYQRAYRFALQDVIQSLGKPKNAAPIQLYDANHHIFKAPRPTHITSYLQTISRTVKAYYDDLTSLSGDDITQLLDMQSQALTKAIEQKRIIEKDQACLKAFQAFQDRDYKRAIMYYRPYKDLLDTQHSRMFSLAILSLEE